MPQQPAFEYLAHGQTPFFRLPASTGPLPSGTRAAFLGVPHDLGVTYQPGTRLAPFHLRRVSALVQSWHPVHQVDVFARAPAVDAGNAAFAPFDRAAMRAAVEARVAALLEAGAVPLLAGGDHSVALPAMRAVARRHGPLAVIHVDAHLDTNGPEVWGDDHHHGTPLRHAIAEGLVAPGQLHVVGLRGPWGSPGDGRLALGHGARLHTADEVAARGAAAIAEAIRREVGDRRAYLTFDIDALDPAFAPGTGAPVPGGLTSREALQLVRGLAGVRLAGMDLVEVCPPLDHADVTAHLGAHLLYEALALVALGA